MRETNQKVQRMLFIFLRYIRCKIETFAKLQREVGKEKTRRAHQLDVAQYAFDFSNVTCPNEAEHHFVRLHFACNLDEFVQHIKCLTKLQIL